jgi:hypothetical protein
MTPNPRRPKAEVIPITVPSRAECWRRIRLAESILEHRTLAPDATRRELLKVLRGDLVAAPESGEVS